MILPVPSERLPSPFLPSTSFFLCLTHTHARSVYTSDRGRKDALVHAGKQAGRHAGAALCGGLIF